MRLHAGGIDNPCVGVEHLADRPAGPERVPCSVERLDGDLVHPDLPGRRRADAQRAHEAGMIAPVDAGEFQGELVLRIQMPPAGEIAAQQRLRPGADDEFVAGIVTAAAEHRALHRGQDIAFEGAGSGVHDRFAPCRIGQFRGAADIGPSPPGS